MAIRSDWTILGSSPAPQPPPANGIDPVARVDADLIVAAAIVGFTKGRLVVGHPITFSWEGGQGPQKDAEEEQRTAEAVARLQRVVGQDADQIMVAQAPPWEEGALITGAAGGAQAPFAERHATPDAEAAEQLRRIAAHDRNIGYRGYGAYTGFVDDPIRNAGSVQSTLRANIPSDGFGDRWRPPQYAYPSGLTQDDAPWGLLNKGNPIDGMPARPYTAGGVVGYTHGMIQAVYEAVATGPWCTPFEIAVGDVTKKLASCAICTIFMYAAGFPPSAIHLGRGDSWLPFYPAAPGSQGYSMVLDEAIRSTNTRWCLECWQHLSLGVDLLGPAGLLSDAHAQRLGRLRAVLDTKANDLYAAANLILDALTVEDSLTTRIARAIRPPA